jgi:hypothetical protein
MLPASFNAEFLVAADITEGRNSMQQPAVPPDRTPTRMNPVQQSAGGIPMHTPDDNRAPSGSVMRRLIRPWEYRHLHAVANVRFAAGGFQLGVGLVLLSLGRQARTDRERRRCYSWAAWFLGMSALQFTGGVIDVVAARSEPPQTQGG